MTRSVWIATAKTESGDQYNFMFDEKPTRDKVAGMVWEQEGEIEDLDWYTETTNIIIYEHTPKSNSNSQQIGQDSTQKLNELLDHAILAATRLQKLVDELEQHLER